jgi:Domain of unknown function (DUF2019)
MKPKALDGLTDDELIGRFSAAARQMGVAVLDLEPGRANRQFRMMRDIDSALRSRGSEAYLKLLALLDEKDRFVRYYAAKRLLGVAPARAR